MKMRVLATVGVAAMLLAALPGAVLGDRVEVLNDVRSSIAYHDPETGDPVPARVDCDVLIRVLLKDGSANEWQACTVPEEGMTITVLDTPYTESGGECRWRSDYWATKDGSAVYAVSYEMTVRPSGDVFVSSEYPAEPLVCQEEDGALPSFGA